ncbi:hypothetical protein INT43_001001 [Umbelopsis isabellina]|uniref:Uncharacterized protein n=1 Tax=Mortierella isabellina TaxID=91625 RepID=A0A8H7Q379_MORIS|nr:hypothetical protein INT43_001001 [Umbelopsis isabellina]
MLSDNKVAHVPILTHQHRNNFICSHCQDRFSKKWKSPDGRQFHGILCRKKYGILWNRDTYATKKNAAEAQYPCYTEVQLLHGVESQRQDSKN